MQVYRALRAAICLLAILVLLGAPGAWAQQGDQRPAGRKLDLQQLRALPSSNHVVVKFRDGEKIRRSGDRLTGMRSGQADDLNQVLREAGVSEAAVKPLHAAPPEELERDTEAAQRSSGKQLADLSLYFVIELPPGANAAEVANALNALPFVEYAQPALRPAPPPIYDVPQRAAPLPEGARAISPDLSSTQAYKAKAPRGIGPIPSIPGADGAGMSYVDVEYDWAFAHEDLTLPAERELETLTPDPFGGPDHGTAVLGILSGVPNTFGVTGIVPAARPFVARASTVELGYQPARAIGLAASVLQPGDVIIIEQQNWVCGTENYGPLEYYQDVFDAIAYASARGIIVVAAAGNGSVNLDDPNCFGLFDRNLRDSQAIIVGAGSAGGRARLDFSSFGSRVDVQGWGENVTTAGYGDAFNPDNDVRRYYTRYFNGTSSATPIVAATVLAIQGVRKACGLPPLKPLEMRNLLVKTGTPQSEPVTTHIGPLPSLSAALRASVPAACLGARLEAEPVSDTGD
jgi:subtilisin family serine protease